MNIEKINPNIKYIYHYTLKKNVNKILNDKAIISQDEYVFFTKSLEDSITAFNREMMQEGKLYIDVNGTLRKREKCNKNDYCILKIPYINDNQFYKFNFENQSKESIYTISISHKGAYKFEKAKVIEFPKLNKKCKLTSTAVAAITTGIILFPYNSYAASWLDSHNYDTDWYTNVTTSNYIINTEKELAGLAHLVNNEQITFDGKDVQIEGDFDLTQNTWQTISDIFRGSICGTHRIILNLYDGAFIKNNNVSGVEYSLNVLENNNTRKVNLNFPCTVETLKNLRGETNLLVMYNNEILSDDTSFFELNLNENDAVELFSGFYIYIENAKGEKKLFTFESGDSIDNVKTKYSEKINIPKEKIIIKYNGKELKNEKTLADYNVQKLSTLQAYIKLDINVNINENEGNINIGGDITTPEDKITITINPKEGYELDKIILNQIDATQDVRNNKLEIVYTNETINIKVIFKSREELEDEMDNEEESEQAKETDTSNIKEESNPKTGDNIVAYIITFCSSIIGIIFTKFKRSK